MHSPEAAPADAEDRGAWLGLQANGVDALQAIGSAEPLLDIGFATPSVRFVRTTGKTLGVVPVNSPLSGAHDGRTMRRSELSRVLQDGAHRSGADIRHSSRLLDAQTSAAGVEATFTDGVSDYADLLIGADGTHSRVRTLLNPTGAPARPISVLNVGGYSDATPAGSTVGELTMCFGGRAFFGYVPAPSGQTWWFANPPVPQEKPTSPAPSAVTDTEWRRRLRNVYRADRFPAVELLDATPGPLHQWRGSDLASVPVWHDQRMVLIGDAGHAVSPSTGQGASLAIEDAVCLARCLRDLPVPEAFAWFEKVRRPRVERIVAIGQRSSTPAAPHALSRVARDLVMSAALRLAARRGQPPAAWIHQHHVDWDNPVTADGLASQAEGPLSFLNRRPRTRAWLN